MEQTSTWPQEAKRLKQLLANKMPGALTVQPCCIDDPVWVCKDGLDSIQLLADQMPSQYCHRMALYRTEDTCM